LVTPWPRAVVAAGAGVDVEPDPPVGRGAGDVVGGGWVGGGVGRGGTTTPIKPSDVASVVWPFTFSRLVVTAESTRGFDWWPWLIVIDGNVVGPLT
jgi:hypothetical protein